MDEIKGAQASSLVKLCPEENWALICGLNGFEIRVTQKESV